MKCYCGHLIIFLEITAKARWAWFQENNFVYFCLPCHFFVIWNKHFFFNLGKLLPPPPSSSPPPPLSLFFFSLRSHTQSKNNFSSFQNIQLEVCWYKKCTLHLFFGSGRINKKYTLHLYLAVGGSINTIIEKLFLLLTFEMGNHS